MTRTTTDHRSRWRVPVARWWRTCAVGALVLGSASCSLDGLLNSDKLPPDVSDPAITQTPQGARAAYTGAVAEFRLAFGGEPDGHASFALISGLLSDEIKRYGGSPANERVDRRAMPEGEGYSEGTYSALQKTRGQAGQAIGLLAAYVPEAPALRAHLYALQGYAELFLAELFCSGIPLSTVDYGGDYTYQPGSKTDEVLRHAMALFDTASTLSGDSVRFAQLAQMGRARALSGLGAFADAAAAVASIPDDYHYDVTYANTTTTGAISGSWQNFARVGSQVTFWDFTVPDREGTNGIDWRASGDPRGAVDSSADFSGFYIYRPSKYGMDGSSPIVLASGVEARLIEAEADLQAGNVDAWLSKLNGLRTGDGAHVVPEDTILDTLGVSQCGAGSPLCGHGPGGDDPVEFGQPTGGFSLPTGYDLVDVDTTYPAPSGVGGGGGLCDQRSWYRPCYSGDSMVVYVYVRPAQSSGTGGVAGLTALSDPGASLGEPAATNARVDLMFRERAMWLFMTGHRQGDLRRLIRQYGRTQAQVYPVGVYGVFPDAVLPYGSDVTIPLPPAERISNPLYTGCSSRSA